MRENLSQNPLKTQKTSHIKRYLDMTGLFIYPIRLCVISPIRTSRFALAGLFYLLSISDHCLTRR